MPHEDPPIRKAIGRSIRSVRATERPGVRPLINACFTGYYRWHATRCLRDVASVRGVPQGEGWAGVVLTERLDRGIGYVTYLAVDPDFRRRGLGGRLLDDAIDQLARRGIRIVFAVASPGNRASMALLRSRSFRRVARTERSYREGGLGAWGVRSRMHIVAGEHLFGRRLPSRTRRRPPTPGSAPPVRGRGGRGRRRTEQAEREGSR